MSRLAYLSGPADRLGEDDYALEWMGVWDAVETDLHALGFDVYRPEGAFGPGPLSAAVQLANDAVMRVSRAGVVCLPWRTSTLEGPVEIEAMLGRNIPVLVVSDIVGSTQLKVWEKAGAAVCGTKDTEEGMLQLAHLVAEAEQRPTVGDALRRLGESFQALVPGPVDLVFEPVDPYYVQSDGPALLPTRGYADDAGLDLYVSVSTEVEPFGFADVPCGVKMDIPAGHWAMITGRSSTLRKRGLLVNTGVIDAGWTGQLFAGVQNLTGETVIVGAGDRLAQLILLPAPVVGRAPVWGRVPKKERGENGFGSTGS